MVAIGPDLIKKLRDETGAGVMDCKRALQEADGDLEEARKIIERQGIERAGKRAGREAKQGLIEAYVHQGRIGALVELNCETDFVARTDDFQEFAREIAIHVAGSPTPPRVVSPEEIPDDEREAERRIFAEKARQEGKPDDVIERIVEGQLQKWSKEVALLDQEHIRSDRYEGKTIEQIRAEVATKTGENVRIARFARFRVGEE